MTTIGIDFKTKLVELDGKKVKLQVWDTAGQERFQTIATGGLTKAYYRGASGVVLIYDITDERSFNNVSRWIRSIDQNADDVVDKILVGNKLDLEDRREVSTAKGEKLAKQFNMKFFEASAKSDINVTESFLELSRQIMARVSDKKPLVAVCQSDTAKSKEEDERGSTVQLQGGSGQSSGQLGCC